MNGGGTVFTNPYKIKIIAKAKMKSDKLDDRILSDLLRTNLIYESYVPCKKTETSEALFDIGYPYQEPKELGSHIRFNKDVEERIF